MQRFLIMSPPALLAILERVADGETPEDLMMEALDEALENPVNLRTAEDDEVDDE